MKSLIKFNQYSIFNTSNGSIQHISLNISGICMCCCCWSTWHVLFFWSRKIHVLQQLVKTIYQPV